MDVKCVVCGEPWNSYGIDHGDMEVWEAKLFRAGSGCPCCEGVSSGYEQETLEDIENGDGDPGERISARDDYLQGKAPPWIEPKATPLWECASCGVIAQKNANGELEYDTFDDDGTVRETPDTVGNYTVCGNCIRFCEVCSCELVHVDDMDCNETGYAFPDPRDEYSGRVVCYDCLGQAEDELRWENWQLYGHNEFVGCLEVHFGLSDRACAILSDVSCDDILYHMYTSHAHYDDEDHNSVVKRFTRKEIAQLLRDFRHEVY